MKSQAALYQDLQEKIKFVEDFMVSGKCSDYTMYCAKVAERRAYLDMIDLLVENKVASNPGSPTGT